MKMKNALWAVFVKLNVELLGMTFWKSLWELLFHGRKDDRED